MWGLRYSGRKDSVSSLPGMSFSVQKMQQRLEALVTKGENAFVPILLYPTDVRKEKGESGLA